MSDTLRKNDLSDTPEQSYVCVQGEKGQGVECRREALARRAVASVVASPRPKSRPFSLSLSLFLSLEAARRKRLRRIGDEEGKGFGRKYKRISGAKRPVTPRSEREENGARARDRCRGRGEWRASTSPLFRIPPPDYTGYVSMTRTWLLAGVRARESAASRARAPARERILHRAIHPPSYSPARPSVFRVLSAFRHARPRFFGADPELPPGCTGMGMQGGKSPVTTLTLPCKEALIMSLFGLDDRERDESLKSPSGEIERSSVEIIGGRRVPFRSHCHAT